MQHYPIYQPQSPRMIQQFLEKRPYCVLITHEERGPPTTGFFNPLVEGESIYLHLHRQDPQLKQLQLHPDATLVFNDYHGYVPSYAKDPEDASFATMFYRFAEIRARGLVIDSMEESAAVLERMMQRYQPEGGYRSLIEHQEFYARSLPMIRVIHFKVESVQAKWKLGQNRTAIEQLYAHSFMHT
ncbi:MAG TPA: FMN-binding negative transcriptional regulator [Oligoflexus sp.]|uniref:FMN-binding negative transcriptional regulator n=1 Tax=Oligoflexus sp. TaxID=1971216 RepID=UPI002D7510BD|nr:FMN-binding negative transcriptional regulator [Oligoflexus sp.]HYX33735.1 FMN-binding negative transcriptional regulator [Oligoflexus sp.]